MLTTTKSYIWGGISGGVLLAVGAALAIHQKDVKLFIAFAVLGVLVYTLVSCLILDNNFVGEMIVTVLGWGFVKFPGLIFTLDLDGILWLLTVKLLFWILGLLLACAFGLLAIALGLVMSVFVYPYAIVMGYREKEIA